MSGRKSLSKSCLPLARAAIQHFLGLRDSALFVLHKPTPHRGRDKCTVSVTPGSSSAPISALSFDEKPHQVGVADRECALSR